MASFVYDALTQKVFNGTNISWTSDTIKVALMTSSYTPNQATHTTFADITNEVSGTGYVAGGTTLTSPTSSLNTTTKTTTLSGASATWAASTITARYAVVYKSTGTANTSPLMVLIDFGSDITSNGSTFSVVWNANGILTITTT